jgi:hypothetical protein
MLRGEMAMFPVACRQLLCFPMGGKITSYTLIAHSQASVE